MQIPERLFGLDESATSISKKPLPIASGGVLLDQARLELVDELQGDQEGILLGVRGREATEAEHVSDCR